MLSHAEKVLLAAVTERQQKLCLDLMRIAIEGLWRSGTPRIVQDFTDHGIEHYERIAGYAVNILSAKAAETTKLSSTEMFLLVGGIYLHDVGMQCDLTTSDGKEIKSRAEALGAEFDVGFNATRANAYSQSEQKAIRKNHHYLSAAWIQYAHQTGRTTLGTVAPHLPYALVPDLMDICLHHTTLPVGGCPRKLAGGGIGRKRLIAALLRFADEMDIAANRVDMTAVTDFAVNPENAVFWWLHNLTEVSFIPPGAFSITLHLNESDFDEFKSLGESFYLDKVRMKNKEAIGIIRDSGFQIFFDADGAVAKLASAPSVPVPIKEALKQLAGAVDNGQYSRSAIPTMTPTTYEPVTEAVPLNSRFYVARDIDNLFMAELSAKSGCLLVKGPRQIGKTSLLIRGVDMVRRSSGGRRQALLTDFQRLDEASFGSPRSFFTNLSSLIRDELALDTRIDDIWSVLDTDNINFARYMEKAVLTGESEGIVWFIDEAHSLFRSPFSQQIFGLLRAFINKGRSLPESPWGRLAIVISYSTEAHLFIKDPNQSPFNVGTLFALPDFTASEISDINLRYGEPLRTPDEVNQLHDLVGGHPYLVRRSLQYMTDEKIGIGAMTHVAGNDDGPFGDHLRRASSWVARSPALNDALAAVLNGNPCPTADAFYQLRSAGVIAGATQKTAKLRNRLYASYFSMRSR